MSPTYAFSEIPTIDLSLAESPATKPELLEQLHHALVSVGFLYVSNHGVPNETIANLVDVLPHFFSLPDWAKEEIALYNSPHFLGYSSVGAETTGGKADRREQWPSQLPDLKPIVQSYITELTSLGERFLRLVAEALSLPPSTFIPFLSDQHRLKLVHYPGTTSSNPADNLEGTQGVGPHKDSSGWWTFLLQASPPSVKGLQVLNKAGNWIDVPCVPGTFVVNIGQAFEVVTNGVCKATTHRMLMEPGSGERFSVPFFQGVRRCLTKEEAVGMLRDEFQRTVAIGDESEEGMRIDSPFLRGKYDTWGESQLRTKVGSHRDVGKKFYAKVYETYVNDD
ncbi:hypothetical protein PAAG_01578 [Paracoccidioides lutzii Pb01]|uniref:Fe2OG dioxygenase domain-containing protein n=1 Tax=Paracoccidioides lutzii (strain ATCC MYA-826 / Pb01) TaxID=502779 RepID=C1GST3_PARBA|nr:hypothetical protein PAAG_01578 [Paracoccidioides lutzii Pb01]EEH39116.2 hypothetical protein PAAG_01578 [Paracoccidioides lutzii Pb01]